MWKYDIIFIDLSREEW